MTQQEILDIAFDAIERNQQFIKDIDKLRKDLRGLKYENDRLYTLLRLKNDEVREYKQCLIETAYQLNTIKKVEVYA